MLLGITDILNDPINYVKGQAAEGAVAAIPEIQSQVKTTVEPYVVVAILVGLTGLIFGAAAWSKTRKPTPALAGRHRR